MSDEEPRAGDDPEVTFVPTETPVPPNLAGAFGYHGAARYVAFHWERSGTAVIYDDGQCSGAGNPWAFLAYKQHRVVAPHLEQYNLGSFDLEADSALIIDTEMDLASIAPLQAARKLLVAQHPSLPELTPYEREAAQREREAHLNTGGWQEAQTDPEMIRKAMKKALEDQESPSTNMSIISRMSASLRDASNCDNLSCAIRSFGGGIIPSFQQRRLPPTRKRAKFKLWKSRSKIR